MIWDFFFSNECLDDTFPLTLLSFVLVKDPGCLLPPLEEVNVAHSTFKREISIIASVGQMCSAYPTDTESLVTEPHEHWSFKRFLFCVGSLGHSQECTNPAPLISRNLEAVCTPIRHDIMTTNR